jgi:hypothetical protein
MADYFTNFSVVLLLNKDQQEYALNLVDAVEGYRNEGQPLPPNMPECIREVVDDWPFDVEAVNEGIWINSQYGGQESACAFIQHLLQKFDFATSVSFEWSHDCSKPRTDAYGGGAAFITSTEIETFSTSEWLRKMAC